MQEKFLIETATHRSLKSESAEVQRPREHFDVDDGDPYREFGLLSDNDKGEDGGEGSR